MATQVTHYMADGHLACGRHGDALATTTEVAQVKCRNCRGSDVFQEARRVERNTARRAARHVAKAFHEACKWRTAWLQKLTDMPGLQRLPRGFKGQSYV
ncbi:hypothetical protein HNE05_11740 [Aquipseudomonas campi]|uniref:Uncharacterized protein n=1 Tax=Aquipseudomonas campi TaxID=2731681 RepID=A0A6M8F5X7_9GAMM|nr:hypothetical protein [Pseudomonas campi]QKE63994.1 hypothetical protein HNE05_11740 [Pseudomonas campi]